VLTFTNGAVTNVIVVPVINNALIEGDREFTVSLSNPTPPGQLVPPFVASVTITDINAGLSFSSAAYSVLKSGVQAAIGVVRTGFTNNAVWVNYATQDGTGTNGVDYTGVSGTLFFTNGQVNQSFSVPITDSTVVKPDKTVLLQLSNPVGTNAVLVSPSAAILTIRDLSGSLVVPAGAALLSESIVPTNGVIDPGETVTMLFGLRNNGGTNTANLVAALLATNGVSGPSGPQVYGALLTNGPSVSRQFSFTANGTNGQAVLATFRLQDGANTNVGNATFTFVLGTSSSSFTNAGAIAIIDNASASPYPSTINVGGVGGSLVKATATFHRMHHSWPADVDALVVSPSGQKMLLMANAGGSSQINGVSLTFDDAAAAFLPQGGQIISGTNKPTTFNPVAAFPGSAPAAPYATNLAAAINSNPNGTWSLYVLDDSPANAGTISNGWSLKLTTANPIGSTVDLVTRMAAAPSPVVVSNNLTYTITVTNYGPSSASGVTLTDTLPANASLVSSNATQGSISVAGSQLTWNAGALDMNAGASLTIVVKPTAAGIVTNTAFVVSNATEANAANNSATITTTVNGLTADLILTLVDAPDPIWLGNSVTYTFTVTNAGPAAATSVSVTNTFLPTAIQVVSGSGYTVSGGVVTFTNLGNLNAGSQTAVAFVIKPLVAGTLTNTATVVSPVTDPLKANNTASVKTVIDALQLGTLKSGPNLLISWPTNTSGYVLESATNLNSTWVLVLGQYPVSNGQFTVTAPIGNGSRYFRLRAP